MTTTTLPGISNAADIARLGATQGHKNKLSKTGAEFETMVLSQLLKPMFEGIKSDGPFGGGEGEEAFKSFYIDAVAKQITRAGGIGINASVQSQLLQMQTASSAKGAS